MYLIRVNIAAQRLVMGFSENLNLGGEAEVRISLLIIGSIRRKSGKGLIAEIFKVGKESFSPEAESRR